MAHKEVSLHPTQLKCYLSNLRTNICVAGIQGGKSTVGAIKLHKAVFTFKEPTDNFIVCTPDYKIMSQATLPVFNRYLAGLGTWNRQDMIFTFANGRQIFFRSMVDPDSIEGITNVRFIWADELGKMKWKAWVNIMGRAAFREAEICGSTTPYKLNWLYHDVYKPWTDGKLPDFGIFQWKSIDNPYFPKAEFNRQKALLDERTFSRKYCGTFEKMTGLVYENFDRVENQVAAFDWKRFRECYLVYCGVDWGYNAPTVMTPRLIAKDGGEDFQIGEFLRSYLTPDEKIAIGKEFKSRYDVDMFVCDNEDPSMIAAFNNAGLKAVPCVKRPGSVEHGIELHNGLIKTRRHKLFKGACPETIDEYESYAYPDKEENNAETTDTPINLYNHLMDANRYVTEYTEPLRQSARRENTFKPQQTHIDQLLKRHMRTGRRDPAYSWGD
jgi:PBSX family phage terminase large subunit